MIKIPRGKWYCQNCVSKAPSKKRPPKKREPKEKETKEPKAKETKDKDTSKVEKKIEAKANVAVMSPPAKVIEDPPLRLVYINPLTLR